MCRRRHILRTSKLQHAQRKRFEWLYTLHFFYQTRGSVFHPITKHRELELSPVSLTDFEVVWKSDKTIVIVD